MIPLKKIVKNYNKNMNTTMNLKLIYFPALKGSKIIFS